jgi:hypothetical protein
VKRALVLRGRSCGDRKRQAGSYAARSNRGRAGQAIAATVQFMIEDVGHETFLYPQGVKI